MGVSGVYYVYVVSDVCMCESDVHSTAGKGTIGGGIGALPTTGEEVLVFLCFSLLTVSKEYVFSKRKLQVRVRTVVGVVC
jgi:hypothetical protein